MSWRRGELWLGSDVLWPGEGAGAPAVAVVTPAPLPSFGPPPGLVASRRRREAWKRRRSARKARAKVVALSPAVMFLIAALRSGGAPAAQAAVDDQPSLTYRLAGGAVEAPDTPVRLRAAHERVAVPRTPHAAPAPRRVHRRDVRAQGSSDVAWHHARSLGLPYAGSLVDGTQLPQSGPNWVTWDPVTDSVPNEPTRLYGNEHTIREVISVAYAYRAAHPHAPRIVVGDISRKGGGPMTDEHVSHQNGLDVDVYYPRLDGKLRAPVASGQIDLGLAQDLLDRFVAAGAQMVFVGPSTGLHGPAGVVLPYPGHDYHMHVRFPPRG